MVLQTRTWGSSEGKPVVCTHGVAQHGGVFEALGERLAARGRFVVAVDLRGHGASRREPPWNTDTHVQDLVETIDSMGIERASWVGHSFGGRLVAALAARSVERVECAALLDPGLEVSPDRALRGAEIERLDWSFATVDGAVNALLSSESTVAAPRAVVAAYVEDDVRKGPDGRFRLRFCPSAAVVAWSEMTLPAPPVAEVRTLLLGASVPLAGNDSQRQRYEDALGERLTVAIVPNGHNVLWESPAETIDAVERFLEGAE